MTDWCPSEGSGAGHRGSGPSSAPPLLAAWLPRVPSRDLESLGPCKPAHSGPWSQRFCKCSLLSRLSPSEPLREVQQQQQYFLRGLNNPLMNV